MSDSYLATVYSDGDVSLLGVFDERYHREPRWKNGCCTMSVEADSIEEAMDKARATVGVRKGETV